MNIFSNKKSIENRTSETESEIAAMNMKNRILKNISDLSINIRLHYWIVFCKDGDSFRK